jgi:hypothetical protein
MMKWGDPFQVSGYILRAISLPAGWQVHSATAPVEMTKQWIPALEALAKWGNCEEPSLNLNDVRIPLNLIQKETSPPITISDQWCWLNFEAYTVRLCLVFTVFIRSLVLSPFFMKCLSHLWDPSQHVASIAKK